MESVKTALGIDLSTAATGIVLLGTVTGSPTVLLETEIKSKLKGMARVRDIVTQIMLLVHDKRPDRIVIEGYSLNLKNAASVVPLVELGGALRLMFLLDGLEWLDPRAPELKKFATGSGNAPKEVVMMNVLKRWGHESKTNNTADAYVCAAIGLAHMGVLFNLTKEMQAVVSKLTVNNE